MIKTTDIEFDEMLLWMMEHNRNSTNTIYIHNENVIQWNGKCYVPVATEIHMPDRNEQCICGSGKKFKKCCAK